MTREEINERENLLYTEKMGLESQLVSSDYKIIKCAEAQAVGAEMPYDAEALHQQRQEWRDRINAIEAGIDELEQLEPEEETVPAEAAAPAPKKSSRKKSS